VLLVDNKGKTSHVRSFFRLEVQVHSRNRHDAPWQRYMQVFIKSATFRSPLQATLLFRRGARACAVEKVFFVLLAFCCLQFLTTNAQTNPSTGTVRGILLLLGPDSAAYDHDQAKNYRDRRDRENGQRCRYRTAESRLIPSAPWCTERRWPQRAVEGTDIAVADMTTSSASPMR
jgi:hypothetical protein